MAEQLLETYADNPLFDEAIAPRLDNLEDATRPLVEELTALNGTIADKDRVLHRYRDDYEPASSRRPGTRSEPTSSSRTCWPSTPELPTFNCGSRPTGPRRRRAPTSSP